MRASAVREPAASRAEAHSNSRPALDSSVTQVNPAWQALVFRKCAQCDDEEETPRGHGVFARKTGVNAPMTSRSSSGLSAVGFSHGGSPLPRGAREKFETGFGADFSHVRVHDDARAHESARSLNALAYTYGGNIAFADGQFRPETPSGQHLLAHELTHVVQQTGAHAPQVQRAVAMPTAGESRTAYGPTGGPGAVLNNAVKRFASFQTNASARLAAAGGTRSTDKIRHLQSIASDQIVRLGPLISRIQEVAAGTDTALQQQLVDQLSSGTLDRAEAWLNQVDRPAGASNVQTSSVYSSLRSLGGTSARTPAINQRTAPAVARKSLDVSSPNDPAEIEADRVADAIISGASPVRAIHSSSATVQRSEAAGLPFKEVEEALLVIWENREVFESLIPTALILYTMAEAWAMVAVEAAMAAVEAAVAFIVAVLMALPEVVLIGIIVVLVIAIILIMLLIIVLVLALIYFLVFAEPDDPDDDEDCKDPEDPLTADKAITIPALLPKLDKTTYGHSTLTVNGGTETVGTNMVTEYLTKNKTGGKPPSGQKSIYGFTRLPQARAHTERSPRPDPDEPKYTQEQVYIKGHLLNHNVGGIGTSENLYPITGQANADHVNLVENDVKEKVKDDGLVLSYNVVATKVAGPDLIDVSGDGSCTYQHLDADFTCTYATYRLCNGNRVEKNPPFPPVTIRSRFDETGFADNLKKPEKNCWEKDHPR